MTYTSNIIINDDVIIIDMYVANNIASKQIKQVTMDTLGIVQQFQLEILRDTFQKWINQLQRAKIEDLNDKINQLDLVDKYRSFHSTENEYFLRAHMEH